MKQATLLAIIIAVTSLSFSLPNNGSQNSGVKLSGDTTMMKVSTVQSMLQEIIDATGLQTDFELKEANVLNIEASIAHRKRYILYNPAYITSLNNLTKNRWSVMALLAHEVGHHLNGHTIRKG